MGQVHRPALGEAIHRALVEANDVEIVLLEAPRENWLLRGTPGDELTLSYRVDV
jgi:hypothetical protein